MTRTFGSTEFRTIAPIKRFQAAQIGATTIELRLIVDAPLTKSQQDAICKLVHHFIGYPFEIRFAYIEGFPSGKFEEFIKMDFTHSHTQCLARTSSFT